MNYFFLKTELLWPLAEKYIPGARKQFQGNIFKAKIHWWISTRVRSFVVCKQFWGNFELAFKKYKSYKSTHNAPLDIKDKNVLGVLLSWQMFINIIFINCFLKKKNVFLPEATFEGLHNLWSRWPLGWRSKRQLSFNTYVNSHSQNNEEYLRYGQGLGSLFKFKKTCTYNLGSSYKILTYPIRTWKQKGKSS